MVKLTDQGVLLTSQFEVMDPVVSPFPVCLEKWDRGRSRTMTYHILKSHNQDEKMEDLRLKFDALVSPDNNYVSILQTVRAGGIEIFPVPYVLSNCHHTLCAVGGTINEDDHIFGLGNAKKYGGIFVPPYRAVLHQYMREMMAGCGRMILGSDSHTRYGALGTLGIGEGGGEVAKQLLGRTYDMKYPPVVAVRMTGSPRPGVGPQDIALELVSSVLRNGFSKNKILEFGGPGVSGLSMEYRMGIDVMTTESGALSSVWCTDEKTEAYLNDHGRGEAYQRMQPEEGAYYDGLIEIDLSKTECMIALPFNPGNAISIRNFKERMPEVLKEIEEEGQKIKGWNGNRFSIMSHMKDGEFYPDQALVGGCSGGLFENIAAMADILKGYGIPGDGLSLGINPASLPVMSDLMDQGIAGELSVCGAVLRPAICGPCFGVTDVPGNNQISIRHVTRNYPNREGSKPGQGQMAAVFLMDARSIAATVRNGGRLTAAMDYPVTYREAKHHFNKTIYQNQIFNHYGKCDSKEELVMGPNIADWPKMYPLNKHLLLKVAGAYEGSVTTDELIPSGEASSYRSNPEKISEYTLISRDKDYVKRAKQIRGLETERREKKQALSDATLQVLLESLCEKEHCSLDEILIGSVLAGQKLGEGSSREQAASCQKVLGGFANIANEYATKRYRSNLINWGILPFRTAGKLDLKIGEYVFIQNIRQVVLEGQKEIRLEVLGNEKRTLLCSLDELTEEEKGILLEGSILNYYKK